MSDVLKGNLNQLALPDILNLLVKGNNSGCLFITNNIEDGELYIQDGKITHVVCGIEFGEPALHALLTWAQGTFSFDPQVQSSEITIEKATDVLLDETETRARELQEIRRVIPDDNAIYTLSPAGSSEAVSLLPQEWRILAHVNGSRGASELAEILSMEKIEAQKILARLVSGGLLEVGQKAGVVSEDIIGGEFFDQLNSEFTDLLGPMASYIIEEQIEAMGRTQEEFPRAKVADLIERISADIDDEQKRLQFQQIMLSLLRTY